MGIQERRNSTAAPTFRDPNGSCARDVPSALAFPPFGLVDSINPTSNVRPVCPMSSTEQSSAPTRRHAPTAVERQRIQLDKLLKDPTKAAYIPPPPKDKTIRPPREMMKNVQGSSAGAGSGEFHVYKAGRRREYERLKLLDETSQKVRRTVHELKFPLPSVHSSS